MGNNFLLKCVITGYLKGKCRGAIFGYNVSLQVINKESIGEQFLVRICHNRLFRRKA